MRIQREQLCEVRGVARRCVARLLAKVGLLLAVLVMAALPLRAEEMIDARSGRLAIIETDLILPAGPVELELQRSFASDRARPGLLGPAWRLNWEVTLTRPAGGVVVEEGAGGRAYVPDAKQPGTFLGFAGDRISFGRDGHAVRHNLDGTRDSFDAQGRLVERDYRNGNVVSLRYDAQGRLTRVEGPKGSFLQLALDANGRLVKVESSTRTTVEYAYQGDRLAAVQLNGLRGARYGYDARGALTRIDNQSTGAVELAYDANGRIASRRWADGSQERYEHDAAANRVRRTDALGAVSYVEWSADGRQVTLTDPLGNRTAMEYDAAGRPVTVTGSAGTTRTVYDALGRVASVENAQGQTVRFDYVDSTSRVKRQLRPDGSRVESEYDARGNLTAVRQDGKTLATLTWHADGNLAAITRLGAGAEKLAYHPNGRLASITDAASASVRFEYDARGNLVRETDAFGGVLRSQYDAQERLVAQTDAAGATIRYQYSADGRLSAVIEPTGAITRYRYHGDASAPVAADPAAPTTITTYDARGRPVHKQLPDGSTETYRHDAMGNLIAMTHSSGANWSFSYDAAGQLVELSGPQGFREKFRRDAEGRVIAYEDALGRTTGYSYDALGQLLSVRDAAGHTWRREYDARGRMVALVEPLGRRVRLDYDELDQVVGVEAAGQALLKFDLRDGRIAGTTGPAGGSGRYGYDALGRLTSQGYANGETFRFKLNAAGQLLEAADAAGHAWKASWTPHGDLAALTEPNGARYSFAYTPFGQLARLIDAKGQTREFHYDALGRQTGETDALGRRTEVAYGAGLSIREVKLATGASTRIDYDLLGRTTQVHYPGGLSARFRYDAVGNVLEEEMGAYKAAYRYDALNRRVEARYQPVNRIVRYEYDAAGRRSALEVEGAGRWTYQYDDLDRLVRLHDAQGRTTQFEYDAAGRVTRQVLANGVTVARSYDGRGRMLTLSAHNASNEVLLERRYRHDAAGNLVEEAREGGAKLLYRYDGNGRLIAVEGAASQERMAYDAVGNRLLSDAKAEYDAADQVTRFDAETFTHDAAGRMVARLDGTRKLEYEYDAAGRLAAVKRDGRTLAEYGYDTEGRRVWKKTEAGTRHYVLDGMETLAEFDERGPLATWTTGPEVDQAVAFLAQGKTFFPISDGYGSTLVLTDERGAVTGRWDYRPFGEPVNAAPGQNASALPPRAFSGKEFDAEAGLYYFVARYYDPRLGRFITPDPVTGELNNPPSLHPYQYALNNPLRYRDITGMWASDVADSIDRGAAGVGNSIGPAIGRTAMNVLTGPARVINWFRGDAGRQMNEKLDRSINELSAPVGKGYVGIAAGVVSSPLRLGQATGEMRSRMDQGYQPSAWEQTKMGLTEGFRAVGVVSLGSAGAAVARGGARAVIGGLESYGRSVSGIAPRPAGQWGTNPLARQVPGAPGSVIDDLATGGVAPFRDPYLAGRTFVNTNFGANWHAQLYAHEGFHALITNTANRLGLGGLRDSIYASQTGRFIEETLAFGVQNAHRALFGGPSVQGAVLGRSFQPLLVPVKDALGNIVKDAAGNVVKGAVAYPSTANIIPSLLTNPAYGLNPVNVAIGTGAVGLGGAGLTGIAAAGGKVAYDALKGGGKPAIDPATGQPAGAGTGGIDPATGRPLAGGTGAGGIDPTTGRPLAGGSGAGGIDLVTGRPLAGGSGAGGIDPATGRPLAGGTGAGAIDPATGQPTSGGTGTGGIDPATGRPTGGGTGTAGIDPATGQPTGGGTATSGIVVPPLDNPFAGSRAHGLPRATPEQIAQGLGQTERVPPIGPPVILKGGKKVVEPQPKAYVDPAVEGTQAPPVTPPPRVDMCPQMGRPANEAWVPCPPGVHGGTPVQPSQPSQPSVWCRSASGEYLPLRMYPCPPTHPQPSGPPPTAGATPRSGDRTSGRLQPSVPPSSPPGTQTPAGGTAGGGTTPTGPVRPPLGIAQAPAVPSTPAAAAKGKPCSAPLCRQYAQVNCQRTGPAADCAKIVAFMPSCPGFPTDAPPLTQAQMDQLAPRARAECLSNMRNRCVEGEAGGTGQWCVRKTKDDADCDARARRSCG